ncbi:MAG TPA: amidohydrolase family protein, partial [Longimicrobiales bacterium]|nr:amidohydrolase family protein [Longimicrobiales bacterium]
VDDELVRLLLERDVCYVPTLTRELSTFVYAERPAFFDDPFFRRHAKASEVERLVRPDFVEAMRTSEAAAAYRRALAQASANLKLLADAGVRIAMGTDSGPAGRFPGYFEHLELEMMADAGLAPERILRSATGDAAACLGLDELGTLEEGRRADFLVLSADPLEDVRNTRSLEAAYVSGVEVR